MNGFGRRSARLAVRAGLLAAAGTGMAAVVPLAGGILAQERQDRAVESTREPSQEPEVLMLWGGVRDGELVLEPAFAYEGRPRRPGAPGPYRVRGLDDEGETLFSISFTPGEISDGSKGFSWSIPFDSAWTEALDRLELSGPEGVTTVGREAGAAHSDEADHRFRQADR